MHVSLRRLPRGLVPSRTPLSARRGVQKAQLAPNAGKLTDANKARAVSGGTPSCSCCGHDHSGGSVDDLSLKRSTTDHFMFKRGQDGVVQVDSDRSLDTILRQNEKWVAERKGEDPEYFDKLGAPQKPNFFYIGCSDSRVPANEIMGMGPGEVFVHRNVANLVVGTDVNLMACLQYAVNVLDVQHIIVTGHYQCGGVAQAMKHESVGNMNSWLERIRDVYRLHQVEMDMIHDEDDKVKRLTELNVIEQCLNLYKTDVVQNKRLKTWGNPEAPFAYPRIHGMIFDPSEGKLCKLPIDWKSEIEKYRHIYDLYDTPAQP